MTTNDAPAALDIRPVEPKDRLATIMDRYEALGGGEAVEIVFDHDPRCMYYMLNATSEPGAFTFDYLEEGPEVWRVRVGRTVATATS
jgi:uncharacterized protein (DUF2249 family)